MSPPNPTNSLNAGVSALESQKGTNVPGGSAVSAQSSLGDPSAQAHTLNRSTKVPDDSSVELEQQGGACAQPPALARNPRILDQFREVIARAGVVGEETNASILYLALTSRLLSKPVSIGLKGQSASGKSETVKQVLRFFPHEEVLEFTAMSQKSLIYSQQEYKHRTIVVYELTALREGVEDDMTSYLVRSLLSEGCIDYEVTVHAPGGFKTKRIRKEGPTNLIFTTTKTRVHAENETRVMSLNTDDSPAQTGRVLRAIADERDHPVDLSPWHELQEFVKSGEHRVTIPYAEHLAELIPPVAVRLRRDFNAFLSLIRANAILHQATRDRGPEGQIIATLDDYDEVRGLLADVLSEGVEATVAPDVRETVDAVGLRAESNGVTVRELSLDLKLDRSTASRRLKKAGEAGYVRNLENRRGVPGRWVLADPLPEHVQVLPDTVQLARSLEVPRPEADHTDGVCRCAPESEGENAERWESEI